jgi:hypothetical protein
MNNVDKMNVVELSSAAFAELTQKVDTPVVIILDRRLALTIGNEIFTTAILECPDCAAHLQFVENKLRFLKHVT